MGAEANITAREAVSAALQADQPAAMTPAPAETTPPPETPVAQTTPETPAAPVAPEVPKAPTATDLLRQSLGVDSSVSDQVLAQAARDALARQEAYAARVAELEAKINQQQAPKPAEPQQKPFWQSRPQWDASLASLITQDQNGLWKPRDETPAARQAAEQANAVVSWKQQAAARFFDNPDQALQEMMGGKIEETAKKIAEERMREQEQQAWMRDFGAKHFGWMVQHAPGTDGQLKPQYQPNGQAVLSPAGQLFWQATDMLRESGITDWRRQAEIATMIVAGQMQQAAPTQQPIPQQPQPAPTRGQEIRAASQGKPPATTAPVVNVDQELRGLSSRELVRRMVDGVSPQENAGDFARRFGV